MSTSMSYLYHILCNTLIFSMVYFRGGQMRRISKDITKHYQMACSSMSYTPFAFYGLMFSMCLFCLFYGFFVTCV